MKIFKLKFSLKLNIFHRLVKGTLKPIQLQKSNKFGSLKTLRKNLHKICYNSVENYKILALQTIFVPTLGMSKRFSMKSLDKLRPDFIISIKNSLAQMIHSPKKQNKLLESKPEPTKPI